MKPSDKRLILFSLFKQVSLFIKKELVGENTTYDFNLGKEHTNIEIKNNGKKAIIIWEVEK